MRDISSRTHTVVLGLGNRLLGDDAAGVEVAERLKERFPEDSGVAVIDGGTLSFTLATLIEDTDHLIVVDAAQLGTAPGTWEVFEDDAMDTFLGTRRLTSVHEVSLLDLLTMARLTEQLPKRRALVGIQPQSVDWSDALTEPVARSIPAVCEEISALIDRWQS